MRKETSIPVGGIPLDTHRVKLESKPVRYFFYGDAIRCIIDINKREMLQRLFILSPWGKGDEAPA